MAKSNLGGIWHTGYSPALGEIKAGTEAGTMEEYSVYCLLPFLSSSHKPGVLAQDTWMLYIFFNSDGLLGQ